MRMKRGVDMTRMISVLLLTVVIIVSTSTRATACLQNGEHCLFYANDCCAGSNCYFHPTGRLGFTHECAWCPGVGDPCGALDPCCPGYTCDGYISGTCS